MLPVLQWILHWGGIGTKSVVANSDGDIDPCDAFIYDIYLFNSSSFLVYKNLHRVLDNFFLENLPTT